MAHIFVSYSHQDSDFATILIEKLKDAGFAAWTDAQISAGEDWREKIDEAINASFCLLVVMSPTAQASEYVTYEWAYGWGAGIKVIPLMLHALTKLHPRLEALQYLDFTKPAQRPWEQLIKRLSDLKDIPLPAKSKRSLDPGIEQLVNDLQSPDNTRRRNAAKVLGNLKDGSVVSDLTYVLANDKSWAVRWDVAYALGEIKNPECIVWLIRAIHNDQSARVRQSIAWALGEVALTETTIKHGVIDGVVSSLKQIASEDRDNFVRQTSVKALGKISRSGFSSLGIQALIASLDDYFSDKTLIIDELTQNDSPEVLAAIEKWRSKQQKK